MRALSGLALLASACATTGAVRLPQFTVRQTLVYQSFITWQRSPWYRVKDSFSNGPVYVVVTHDDRACVVPAAVWVRVARGGLHSCDTGWRAPRPRPVPDGPAPF